MTEIQEESGMSETMNEDKEAGEKMEGLAVEQNGGPHPLYQAQHSASTAICDLWSQSEGVNGNHQPSTMSSDESLWIYWKFGKRMKEIEENLGCCKWSLLWNI